MNKKDTNKDKYLLIYGQSNNGSQINLEDIARNLDITLLFSADKKTTMELMRKHDVGVVLVSYKSSQDDSITFLRYIMKQHPHTQRIYISDRIDREFLELIINKAHINYFIALPAEKDSSQEIIHKAFKRFQEVSKPYRKFDELADITVELIEDIEKYHEEAQTDKLTELMNRRAFDTFMEHSFDLFKTKGISFSLVFLDLDKFKKLNDTYGHQAGDLVLKTFAEILKSQLRKADDVAFRYGGEEFAVIARGAKPVHIKLSMDRILERVRETNLEFEGKSIHFTFSAGIEEVNMELDKTELIKRADAALYYAKRNGRNQNVIFDASMLNQ
jgi:diguanylate cyclase (GGDEF)-like protein